MTAGRQGGFALVLALIALLLVSFGLALVATSMRLEMEALGAEETRVRLTTLSDAALAESLAELKRNPSYAGFGDKELDGGRISAAVRRESNQRYRVNVRAEYRERERRTEAIVRRRQQRLEILAWRRLATTEHQ